MVSDLLIDSLKRNDIWINIKGKSMSPFLEEGASVLVSKAHRIYYSDILVYRNGDQIIVHRLIRRRKSKSGAILYQTKADNGYCLDEPVSSGDIFGKIIAFRRKDRILRLDTFLSRIKALIFWGISVLKLISYKYVKI